MAAHALSGLFLPEWHTLGVWLLLGVFLSHALFRVLPLFPNVFSERISMGVQLGGILWGGGLLSILVAGLGFCLRKVFEKQGAPLSMSALFLIPSILWFYAGY